MGHDANVTFSGPNARDWCVDMVEDKGSLYLELADEPVTMPLVCDFTSGGLTVRVRDTGSRVYGSGICPQLMKALGY